MESFVFQLTKSKEAFAVPQSSDWFMTCYSDFWAELKSEHHRRIAIRNLSNKMNAIPGIAVDAEAEIVTVIDKEAYFRDKLCDIKTYVNKLTISDFSTKSTYLAAIEMALHNRYEFRAFDGANTSSFDDFVRRSSNGERYYIGGVAAYHF